jgi:hypothetical protein
MSKFSRLCWISIQRVYLYRNYNLVQIYSYDIFLLLFFIKENKLFLKSNYKISNIKLKNYYFGYRIFDILG